jgi:integrase
VYTSARLVPCGKAALEPSNLYRHFLHNGVCCGCNILSVIVRKGFLEHYEYVRLKEALPEDILPVLGFGYYTGCRKGEILSLHWDQVDLSGRIVRLHPCSIKKGPPARDSLAGELYNVLITGKRKRDKDYPQCAFVFSRAGRPIRNFRKSWDQACVRAGLVDSAGQAEKMFEDLRRTGVLNLIRAGFRKKPGWRSGGRIRGPFSTVTTSSARPTCGRRQTGWHRT